MRPLVLDASAAVESLRAPDIAGIFGWYDVCAPTLLRWEVGNAVHGRLAALVGDLSRRQRVVRALVAPVRLVDQADREDAIGALAGETRLTFYDAAYVQLAVDCGAVLLTEDDAMRKAARRRLPTKDVWDLDDVPVAARVEPPEDDAA